MTIKMGFRFFLYVAVGSAQANFCVRIDRLNCDIQNVNKQIACINPVQIGPFWVTW